MTRRAYTFLFSVMWLVHLSVFASDSPVTIVRRGDIVSIGNDYLVREFSLKDGKVYTQSIVNKRTGKPFAAIVPQLGSEEFIIKVLGKDTAAQYLNASALSLDRMETTAKGEHTQKLIFHYKPYRLLQVDWQINLVYTMEKGKHYMHKYLEIGVPESQREQARIDYIDFESIKIPDGYSTWTHPEMENGVGGVNGYYISLGQPVYIQAMFFGLEFPAAESEITAGGIAHLRYYSGKNFETLHAEKRLVNDDFITWKEVTGAARSTDMDVIRSDFFSYINDIAAPIKLRTQYNSWYDFMMDINENNILTSFREIERGLTGHGVPPLDSYVVDDGWNAYGPYQEENTAKFWSFNSKFPNGLSTPTKLAHQLASNFGLWLGPRGGYNYNNEFAHFLEDYGNGKRNANSWDICTNHKIYLQKLKTFFLDCEKKYAINYWKLDGFMITPPQPDPLGNYITGGYKGMYYVTEHWERWIGIFKAMRDFRGDKRDDLWINLTCYMNPSPWFLQWVNSVWIQNSADMGRLDVGRKAAVDQLLSYRDGRYFDFVKTRAFQFPLSHVYNHDPIYGNTAGLSNQMNDDEFRTYLMMMATRGTAFWELYYSYNMMDEGQKWAVNADVLQWIRDNYSILRHAKLIGQTPEKAEAYGFSAWKDSEGIISVRNPSNRTERLILPLNRTIGMREGLKKLYRTTEWAFNTDKMDDNSRLFNYNDSLSLTLQPGEVRIWKFSNKADKKAPVPLDIKTTSAKTLTVEFNESVEGVDAAKFTVAGNLVEDAVLLADRHRVKLTLGKAMEKNQGYRLTVKGVADLSGNKSHATSPFIYFENQQIPPTIGIGGIRDFTISFILHTKATATPLLAQGKDISIRLDADGGLVFDVKGVEMTSSVPVNTGKDVLLSLCRERNGMLKIYINGNLDHSVYDKNLVNPPIRRGTMTVNKLMNGQLSHLLLLNDALDYKMNDKLEQTLKKRFTQIGE